MLGHVQGYMSLMQGYITLFRLATVLTGMIIETVSDNMLPICLYCCACL